MAAKQHKRYQLQYRKYSSNIIEKDSNYDDNTVTKPKWIPYICPVVKKEEGDVLAERLLSYLLEMEYEGEVIETK